MRLLRGPMIAWAALHALAAFAQIEAAPSEFAACLTPAGEARNQLAYPQDALREGVAGQTTVEIEFAGGTDAPTVKVKSGSDPRLDKAVVEHVSRYRVRCLPTGATTRFVQQFVFAPNPAGKTSWTEPVDPETTRFASCVQHLRPGSKPGHPLETPLAMISGMQYAPRRGNALARFVFTSKDGPPQVTVLGDNVHPAIRRSVEQWAVDYRMPCYDGEPVKAIQVFQFKLEGDAHRYLKDMPLLNFLYEVKDLDKQRRYFELDSMSCPFDVRFEYRQPGATNHVRDVGPHIAARQPFLDWLASMRFDLKPQAENLLVGESMTIAVPCGKIDL